MLERCLASLRAALQRRRRAHRRRLGLDATRGWHRWPRPPGRGCCAAIEPASTAPATSAGGAATHDLVLFVDDDVVVDAGWADAFAAARRRAPRRRVRHRAHRRAARPGRRRPAGRGQGRRRAGRARRLDARARSATAPAWRCPEPCSSASAASTRRSAPAAGSARRRRSTSSTGAFAAGLVGRYEPRARAWHDQWRDQRAKVGLDWRYGIGEGARLVKLAAQRPTAGAAGRRRRAVARGACGAPPADLRQGYQLGAATKLARVGRDRGRRLRPCRRHARSATVTSSSGASTRSVVEGVDPAPCTPGRRTADAHAGPAAPSASACEHGRSATSRAAAASASAIALVDEHAGPAVVDELRDAAVRGWRPRAAPVACASRLTSSRLSASPSAAVRLGCTTTVAARMASRTCADAPRRIGRLVDDPGAAASTSGLQRPGADDPQPGVRARRRPPTARRRAARRCPSSRPGVRRTRPRAGPVGQRRRREGHRVDAARHDARCAAGSNPSPAATPARNADGTTTRRRRRRRSRSAPRAAVPSAVASSPCRESTTGVPVRAA